VGWSLDFLVSRSEDPGWISDVLTFIGAQSAYLGFAFMMAGVALIVWNERRRTARMLEESSRHSGRVFPLTLQMLTSCPSVYAVVRIEVRENARRDNE
jgi:hypothetical protein